MDNWDLFYKTGRVEDYLKYVSSPEGRKDADDKGSDNARRTKRGEQ